MKITHLTYTCGDGAHSYGSARAEHEGVRYLLSFYGTGPRNLRRRVEAAKTPWGADIRAHYRAVRSKRLIELARQALIDFESAQYEVSVEGDLHI